MRFAQDYLNGQTTNGETLGGFNARLYGESQLKCMDGIPSGSRWGQRNAGWELANSLIEKGEAFSMIKTNGGESVEFKCYPDGDEWCCVGPDFVNLQESSNYAFGNTREGAIASFCLTT